MVHEQFFTDTADYADVVLPAPTFLETKDVQGAYGHLFAQVSQQAIAPLGEAWSNVRLFGELAQRMGFRESLLFGHRRRADRPGAYDGRIPGSRASRASGWKREGQCRLQSAAEPEGRRAAVLDAKLVSHAERLRRTDAGAGVLSRRRSRAAARLARAARIRWSFCRARRTTI